MIFPSKREAEELLERNNEMITAYIELKRKYEELVSLRDEEDRIEERFKKIIDNYKKKGGGVTWIYKKGSTKTR